MRSLLYIGAGDDKLAAMRIMMERGLQPPLGEWLTEASMTTQSLARGRGEAQRIRFHQITRALWAWLTNSLSGLRGS